MQLSVTAGMVQAGDIVYAGNLLQYASTYNITGLTSDGFILVRDLIAAANSILLPAANDVTVGGNPLQNYELALAQALQSVSNNSSFLQLSAATIQALDMLFANGLVS